uniref:Secreted protein n=1 Tax=Ixodes ricinus TaxID=34613 RepID=V5H5S2_IXORI
MTPSVTCILLLGTALFFLPATRAQCINVTLPNVLGLGRCLGTTLRTCPDTSEGLLSDLLVILRCVVGILPEVANPASVLFNVVGLLEAVLSRLGISADIAGISNLICRPFGFALLPLRCVQSGKPGVQRPDSDQPSQRVQHWKLSQQDSSVLRKWTNNLGSHLD